MMATLTNEGTREGDTRHTRNTTVLGFTRAGQWLHRVYLTVDTRGKAGAARMVTRCNGRPIIGFNMDGMTMMVCDRCLK